MTASLLPAARRSYYSGAITSTGKPEPNDVDVFLVMADTFDASRLSGDARLLFDDAAAQAHFGASVFWVRCRSAWPDEPGAVELWPAKRDGGQRGIVEIASEAS